MRDPKIDFEVRFSLQTPLQVLYIGNPEKRNLQVVDGEHFFELDGELYKVLDPKALVEVSRERPKKQANAEQRKLSGFKQWYANRRGVF